MYTTPFSTGLLAAGLLAAAPAAAQDLQPKAPPQAGPIAIVNAVIHPVSAPVVERGWVLFDAGRIVDVGAGERAFPGEVAVVDAEGHDLWPGLVGALTQIGLVEHGAVRASRDMDEVGAVTPEVRTVVAVNPDSTVIPVTRSNGVLTVGVFPTAGAIPGRMGVIQLDGWTWADMALVTDGGLVVDWPTVRPVRRPWMDQSREEQTDRIQRDLDRIEDAFTQAETYLAARAADPSLPVDLRWEAMRNLFADWAEGEQLRVYVDASEYDQILSAVAFARRHGLRMVLVGGRDADLCADVLRDADVPVLVRGTLHLPRRDDSPYDEPFTLPAKLEAAGVRWALASGQEPHHERGLPYAAAMAVAHGLDPDVAMRSITLSAAELLGVGADLGSIEPGKLATLILTDGNPLEITTHIGRAWIAGREISLWNKQKALDAKYREKYRQIGLIAR